MSRKLNRLVLAAAVVAGIGFAPVSPAGAGTSGIAVSGTQFGNGKLEIFPGDTVQWKIADGVHTVSPDPGNPFPTWPKAASGDLSAGGTWEVTFQKPGSYDYKCEKHPGMVGEINVKDPSTPPPTAATTTTTTAPATTTTTAAPASSQGTTSPSTASPAPTTTTKPAKDNKDKDDKDKKDDKKHETTTTTVPPPPPVDLPDSAIVPVLPSGSTQTTTQNGVEAPDGAPEGDAIALLKPKKSGNGNAVKLLIVSGIGLGALVLGTAGYRYANRSSKYFPA